MIVHSLSGPYFKYYAVTSSHPEILLFFSLLLALLTSVCVKGCRISIGGMSFTCLVLPVMK